MHTFLQAHAAAAAPLSTRARPSHLPSPSFLPLITQVIATSGDTHLGGEDFDNRVIQHLLKVFKRKHGSDPSKDKKSIHELRT